MKLYHPGLDIYDEQPDRKAKTLLASGWEAVDPADAPAADKAATPDNVEYPDDPAVESITYTEAEMKKRSKTTTKKDGNK